MILGMLFLDSIASYIITNNNNYYGKATHNIIIV